MQHSLLIFFFYIIKSSCSIVIITSSARNHNCANLWLDQAGQEYKYVCYANISKSPIDTCALHAHDSFHVLYALGHQLSILVKLIFYLNVLNISQIRIIFIPGYLD